MPQTTITNIGFSCAAKIVDSCSREVSVLTYVDKNHQADKSRLYKRMEDALVLYEDNLQRIIGYAEFNKVDVKDKRVVDALRSLASLRTTIDGFVTLYGYTKIKPLYPIETFAELITSSDDELVDFLLAKKEQLRPMEYLSYLTWIIETTSPRIETIVKTERSQKIFEFNVL